MGYEIFNVVFRLFWKRSKPTNLYFLKFKTLGGPYIQIYTKSTIMILIFKLLFIQKWYSFLFLNNLYLNGELSKKYFTKKARLQIFFVIFRAWKNRGGGCAKKCPIWVFPTVFLKNDVTWYIKYYNFSVKMYIFLHKNNNFQEILLKVYMYTICTCLKIILKFYKYILLFFGNMVLWRWWK